MVKTITYLSTLIILISCIELNNIKYYNKEVLTMISTEGYYHCVGVYFSDKNYNIIRELSNTARILKFRKDGYIEFNDDEKCGVIYIKNKKLIIDLIGGTSDRSKIIRTYKVKVEGNRIHMLEEAAVTNELIYYIYELRNR